MSDDIIITALAKGSERYIFVFNDDNVERVLQAFGRFASNPELSFSWNDAMKLSRKVRAEIPKE